jgi:REP element-mobilizing transposase RayT
MDEDDYAFFEFLLQRCFGLEQLKSQEGKLFPWFGDRIQLNAFCLMPNHFHLLLHQGEDSSSLSQAMQSLATTYSMYFNAKYARRGSLFESVFKASPILNEPYLTHITRYIHLNPKDYKTWPHSSYNDYLRAAPRSWITCSPIAAMFASRGHYQEFVDGYVEMRDKLADLKDQLADYGETCYII